MPWFPEFLDQSELPANLPHQSASGADLTLATYRIHGGFEKRTSNPKLHWKPAFAGG
jgi:hypothetical protein